MPENQKVNPAHERAKSSQNASFGSHPLSANESGASFSPVPFQLKASTPTNPAESPGGGSGSPGGLPAQLQANLESMSGHDMSDVKVNYNSSKPAQMKAHAYAQGSDIHLGPGQEKHLAHEAWHVVQQKEGRVKPTTEVNGAAVNDDAGLEKEADQMGDKAMSGAAQHKEAPAKSSSPAGKGAAQLKKFDDEAEKEEYFKEYKATAETVLAKWYERTKTKNGRDKLTAEMFVKAARKIYAEKKDTKFIVPVEFAMAQARLEGGVARNERLGQGNVFNVAAYDSGVSSGEKKINSLEKGFDAYYKFMANSMLDDKSADELLEGGNFTKGPNKTGGVYATNPVYEAEIKGEIGKMRMASDGFRLSGTVGKSATNKPADVKKVGALLLQAGYIGKDDIADAGKVAAGILAFQKKELAPTDAKWFKDRYKAVTNPIDKKNVDTKIGWFKDGVVSNSGHTLGALYYKTAMGGKISKESGESKSKPKGKSDKASNTSNTSEEGGSLWDSIVDYVSDTYDSVVEWGESWFGSEEETDTKAKETSTGVGKAAGGAKAAAKPKPVAATKISGSVGSGGKNQDKDVRVVQSLLIKAGYLPKLNSKGKSNVDGKCGDLTIGAIRKFQKVKGGFSRPDGLVEVGGTTWKLLTGQPVSRRSSGGGSSSKTTKANVAARPELSASSDVLEQIKTNFPDGVNVAIYANYAKTGKASKDNNNKEFPRAAGKYAKAFNSVGYDASGTLKLGLARPITDLAGVTNVINDVHKLLLKEHRKSDKESKEVPAYTKIKTLALFAHGMPWGMHLKENGRYNARIDSAAEEKKFEAFVKGIKGALKDDVVVNLMACNAGREADGTEKKGIWHKSDADKQDGSSSFAAKFAEELGSDASVYAHLSAGHTVNNYSARVFGKDAGKDATKDKGGVHIFYLLYPDSFITSEAKRLKKDKKAVSAKMWKHFKRRMADSHSGKFKIENSSGDKEKVGLGAEMFSDIGRAKTILQTDWKTWVTSNPVG